MTQWSLCGLVIQLANKAVDYDHRAIKLSSAFVVDELKRRKFTFGGKEKKVER